LLRRRSGGFVEPLANVFDKIAGLPFGRPEIVSGLSPPELSTLIRSQIKPRVCVTSAMCDIGRCSSLRRHGVSQNSTTLFDTPTWSATMRAGNTNSVMLKCTSAHRRLERSSMWSLMVELCVTDASGAIDVRGTRSYHERG
jgi:hypothetical protein